MGNLLAREMKLPGDLVGDESSERPAQQGVGPRGLRAAHRLDVAARHGLETVERLAVVAPARSLEAVDRSVGVEVVGQVHIAKHAASRRMEAEEGRARAAALKGHEGEEILAVRPPAQQPGHLFDGRGPEQGGQREILAEPAAHRGGEPQGEQGVTPEGEEVVIDSDRTYAEQLFPELHQLELERVARRPPFGEGSPLGSGGYQLEPERTREAWQMAAQEGADLGGRGPRTCRQGGFPGALTFHLDEPDRGMPPQHRRDLAGVVAFQPGGAEELESSPGEAAGPPRHPQGGLRRGELGLFEAKLSPRSGRDRTEPAVGQGDPHPRERFHERSGLACAGQGPEAGQASVHQGPEGGAVAHDLLDQAAGGRKIAGHDHGAHPRGQGGDRQVAGERWPVSEEGFRAFEKRIRLSQEQGRPEGEGEQHVANGLGIAGAEDGR